MASRVPQLSVGCHVLLVDASPVLELQQGSVWLSFLTLAVIPALRNSATAWCPSPASRWRDGSMKMKSKPRSPHRFANCRRRGSGFGIPRFSETDAHVSSSFQAKCCAPRQKMRDSAVRVPFEPLFFAGTKLGTVDRAGDFAIFSESFREALGGPARRLLTAALEVSEPGGSEFTECFAN